MCDFDLKVNLHASYNNLTLTHTKNLVYMKKKIPTLYWLGKKCLCSFTLQHCTNTSCGRRMNSFSSTSAVHLRFCSTRSQRGVCAVANVALQQENTLSCKKKKSKTRKLSESIDAVIGLENLNFQNHFSSSCCVK